MTVERNFAREFRGALAAVLFALALACSPRPAPVAGVVHLDPRLSDGRSSSEVLAAQRETVAEFRIAPEVGAEASLPEPWVADGGRLIARGELLAFERDVSSVDAPRLVYGAPVRSQDFDVVEFELDARHTGRARLEWIPADDPNRRRHLDVAFTGEGRQVLQFAASSQDGWRGDLSHLALVPSATAGDAVAPLAVRFLRAAFTPGPSPLAEGTDEGEPGFGAGDGGLVTFALETRRAWPSDLDVPLLAAATAPAGAVLSVDVAFDGTSRTLEDSLHVACDARRPGGTWRRLGLRSFVPKDQPAETLWRPWHVPLLDLAGGAVELRLVAHQGGDGADLARVATRAPAAARVFWGRPMLVAPPGEERLPNLLLISFDTARADRFAPWSEGRRTPFLASLAPNSLVFENAFATSNSTQPSHASMLTGLHPIEHGVLDNFSVLAPENQTLPELLRARGYLTAGAVSQQFLGSAAGFGQGFDQFLEAAPSAAMDGAITVRGVRRWLESWAEGGPRPWFLWLHLFDPHTPYTPTAPFLEHYLSTHGLDLPRRGTETPDMPVLDVLPEDMEFLRGVTNRAHAEFLYEVCTAYADALAENLGATLSQLGQLGSTSILVTADHGESLGERDNWFNHKGVFPEVTRVPLLLHWPGVTQGARVATPASLIDLLPTYAGRLGLAPSARLAGRDLFDLAEPTTGRRVVWFEHSESWQAGYFDGRHYFLETLGQNLPYGLEVKRDADGRRVPFERLLPRGSRFLYDLESDPKGLENLATSAPEETATAARRLVEYRAALVPRARRARDLTAAERQNLGALGYGSGGTMGD